VVACVYFGFETSFNIGYAQEAVARLFPGG